MSQLHTLRLLTSVYLSTGQVELSFHQCLPPAGWYWEDQCWLECRARELASLTFSFSNIPPRETFPGGTCKLQKPPADDHMTKVSAVLYSHSHSVYIGSLSLVSFPSVNSGICWHVLELPLLVLPQDTLVVSGVFGECSCPYLAVRGCVVWVICTKDTHSVQGISGLACSIPVGSGFLKHTAPLI